MIKEFDDDMIAEMLRARLPEVDTTKAEPKPDSDLATQTPTARPIATPARAAVKAEHASNLAMLSDAEAGPPKPSKYYKPLTRQDVA